MGFLDKFRRKNGGQQPPAPPAGASANPEPFYPRDFVIHGHRVNVMPAKDSSEIVQCDNLDVLTVFRQLIQDNISFHYCGTLEKSNGKHTFTIFFRHGNLKEQTIPNIDTNHMSPPKAMQACADHINNTFPDSNALHTEAEKIRGRENARIVHRMDQREAKLDTIARRHTTGLAAFIDAMIGDMLQKAEATGSKPEWSDEYKETLRSELARWYRLEQQRAANERK